MLNNALAYFSPPSTPRKSVMQFFENLNPLNSFKSDPDNHMASHSSQDSSISGNDKSHKSAPKNPLAPKSAAAAFYFSNNTIVPTTSTSVYPTTLSPAAIILDKPPSGRSSRPLSAILGKKKPPPPPPTTLCDPSTSSTASKSSPEINQELDPEVLAGALAKAGLLVDEKEDEGEEEIEESPALFPPRPPKPNHLSRSSSMKPVSPSPSSSSTDTPPPIPPKTYKKNYGYSS
jgi:hypothetical protein